MHEQRKKSLLTGKEKSKRSYNIMAIIAKYLQNHHVHYKIKSSVLFKRTGKCNFKRENFQFSTGMCFLTPSISFSSSSIPSFLPSSLPPSLPVSLSLSFISPLFFLPNFFFSFFSYFFWKKNHLKKLENSLKHREYN